ncbi:antimicrobial peptide 1b-like [Hordeum vulgare subsp. vulgare]|uniref:antimicrobial peptide 1b-like n=1 Tax=Hordeum vulgare subsp. vulgare TaxID=112509 RepID=UPI000B4629D2|nr:antimicrobial peptide 1b-like [Hordeum vulgare subsp. vulgare]
MMKPHMSAVVLRSRRVAAILLAVVLTAVLATAASGDQARGAKCPNCLCCGKYGFCGSTPDYCDVGCQSQCRDGVMEQALPTESDPATRATATSSASAKGVPASTPTPS